MNITDEDELSPSEYDRKIKKERELVTATEAKYSKMDMFSFATYVVRKIGTAMSINLNVCLADWTRAKDRLPKGLFP